MRDKTYIPIQHLDSARESAREIAQRMADDTGEVHSIKVFFQGPRRMTRSNTRSPTTNKSDAHGATIGIYSHKPGPFGTNRTLEGYWTGDLPEN